jgi:predicted transcriptional regulator
MRDVEERAEQVLAAAAGYVWDGERLPVPSAFAAGLLMPHWLFVREHARCGGDVAELGRAFGTSAAATERRVLALFGDS